MVVTELRVKVEVAVGSRAYGVDEKQHWSCVCSQADVVRIPNLW